MDWGIGHATRIIPIIHHLINNGNEVIIAGDGLIKSLLQQEFPMLQFISLAGYKVKYARQKIWLPLKILVQLPRLLLSVIQEQQWLKKVVKDYAIKAVISDNRFGLYHATIPCIYITHQLTIKAGNGFLEKIAQKIHYYFIKKYTACWVPDFEGIKNIAGDLSHPVTAPANIKYIGCLSRFEKSVSEIKYDLLIVLSGPEPQRTILEKKILLQLHQYNGKVLFVRGLPGATEILVHPNQASIKNHLNATALNKAIEQSKMVISRSGYTSVMDLIKLQKKALLIPTPGQTEQEYLAQHLMEKRLFFSVTQHKFNLIDALESASVFPYSFDELDMQQYKTIVDQFILSLSQ